MCGETSEDSLNIALFLEDIAHERFIKSLVSRVAGGRGLAIIPRFDVRNATGGKGRVKASFQQFLRGVGPWADNHDLLIVAQDTDCVGVQAVKQRVAHIVQDNVTKPIVTAAPNPCIEAWYLADQEAIRTVAHAHSTPPISSGCDCGALKTQLRGLFREGGVEALLGGAEYAEVIVGAMDLHRAARNVPSLYTFISDLRGALLAYRRGGG